MILYLERNFADDIDLLTFFPRENTITIPSEFWPSTLAAVLRLKNSLIITSKTIPEISQIDQTKRWVTGEDWCWLHPRSLSTIKANFSGKSLDFEAFLDSLRSSK